MPEKKTNTEKSKTKTKGQILHAFTDIEREKGQKGNAVLSSLRGLGVLVQTGQSNWWNRDLETEETEEERNQMARNHGERFFGGESQTDCVVIGREKESVCEKMGLEIYVLKFWFVV